MPDQFSSSSRVRLFKSERLEKLTFISPRAFAVLWAVLLPMIAFVGWGEASVMAALGLCLAGMVTWILFEYAMHRYLFHWKTRWKPAAFVVYLMHGNHHDSPNDEMRNLMPPSASLPIAACVWGLFALALGPAGTWAFLGFMIGYVAYDVTHFACHQWPMRGGLGLMLKRHHMRHHHIDEEANFAITAIFLDRVFGTRISSLKDRSAA